MTPPIAIHIAILNADLPVPAVRSSPHTATYGAIFHTLLSSAASRLSQKSATQKTPSQHPTQHPTQTPPLSPSPALPPAPAPTITITSTSFNILANAYPSSLSLPTTSALLITGSAASAYDDAAWIRRLERFLRSVYAEWPRVKVFGSCFGHQVVCRALLGGDVVVERDPKGWEIGVQEISLAPEFREGFGKTARPLLDDHDCTAPSANANAPLPPTLRLQFIHADHVRLRTPRALPPGWVVVGSTPHCAVQGVYQPGRVLTLQGHFEFDRFVNRETLRVFGEGWGREVLEEGLAAVDQDDDARVVAEMVVRFLVEGVVGEGHEVVGGLLTPL
ncbi:class I glutamine amidotransferase-like protein [Massariosphaeria phaeospora]|uniref:Class I glutamine amidotransferase-like protein n=1 Tax=Massariosphaeria phaeospora TaxID=100035 RepID=A0A7C8I0U7_9PLEO|nr:class I glutamine amidotransferase-like protein [Massariosphaeria phaeospora]